MNFQSKRTNLKKELEFLNKEDGFNKLVEFLTNYMNLQPKKISFYQKWNG